MRVKTVPPARIYIRVEQLAELQVSSLRSSRELSQVFMQMSELDLRFTSSSFAGTWGNLQGTAVERAENHPVLRGTGKSAKEQRRDDFRGRGWPVVSMSHIP